MSRKTIGGIGILLLTFCACHGLGCADAESVFTSGRIENRCDGAIPVCGFKAGCVLGADYYLRGEFPGGQQVIVRTEAEQARLIARILLVDPMFPGTELLVRACSSNCGDCDEGISKDVDLFDLAGDDGILEYHLEVKGRGDHRVEIFSDMAAGFLFTVDVEEP